MKILVKDKWKGGFLDYYKSQDEYRVKVLAFRNLKNLEKEAYVVREKDLKIVYNYLKKFGFKAVLRKTISRLKEEIRNKKYFSVGIGKIIEKNKEAKFEQNQLVGFIAPLHPPLLERIVLPEFLITPLEKKDFPFLKDNLIFYFSKIEAKTLSPSLEKLLAWSIYSGKKFSQEEIESAQKELKKILYQTKWEEAKKIQNKETEIKEFLKIEKTEPRGIKGVLFGYGHYAKTNIIPNIKPIKIIAVHEIDPLQLAQAKNFIYYDTSPSPRKNEKYDIYFIAGYHHTHAPIATFALLQGADVVVEKPIATTLEQLEKLIEAFKKSKGRLFSGYHKRFSPLNRFVFQDLKEASNAPISYHCIVYEIPLPKYHWYRWPNSRTEIVENGCHWIDHFLFLNDFSEPRNFDVWANKELDTFNVWIELKNGALFSMALTQRGSSYIGVQDYVELRTKDKTAKIIDDSIYIAQGRRGIIRKKKINKMKNYQTMYKTIAQRIINKEKGDSLASLEVSARLVIEIEEKLRRKFS